MRSNRRTPAGLRRAIADGLLEVQPDLVVDVIGVGDLTVGAPDVALERPRCV